MIYIPKIKGELEQNNVSYFIPKHLLCEDTEWAKTDPKTITIYIDAVGGLESYPDILKARVNNKLPYKIILDFPRETFNINMFNNIVARLPEIYAAQDSLIIHNICDVRASTTFPDRFKTVPVDFYMCETYYKCILTTHPYDKTLIVDRPAGLNLLIGKLKAKFGRFLASYYFYKHDLLQTGVLGINAYPEDIENMMKANPKYLDYEYFNTIKNYLGPADDIIIVETNEGITAANGWPFDANIFARSSVSYVSETYDMDRHQYPYIVTEKTYRAIINRHPFVIQGSSGQLSLVKSLGFETFSSVISESYNEYDHTNHNFEHVEKTVLAGKELVHKIPTCPELVQEIVNHNFDHFCKSASVEYENLVNRVLEFVNNG